ncbi:MAG: reverse transcriptase family protein [Bryobacteraceae bacterium]
MDAKAAAGRGAVALGRMARWLPALARRFVAAFGFGTRPRVKNVIEFLRADETFQQVLAKRRYKVAHWLAEPSIMQPVDAARPWGLPSLVSAGELAEWLCLAIPELEWLADLRGTARPGHYHYQTVAKQSGAVRLLEAPKLRLKSAQRRILREILDLIPGHDAAHGFRAGRSIRTFTAPHVGRAVVLRMDLRDFFPCIGRSRVQAVFRTLGYPETVADLLGGLCTNAAPSGGPLYRQPHLPQGAPTSPALANLCFYRVDCRLAGLAQAAGLQYTRYADDLAFSGDSVSDALIARVGAIAYEEGFAVQFRKTRVMRRGVRQHLAGLVVNTVCNVKRDEYDRLKATLHNCVQGGPGNESWDVLAGRVGFVESVNPARGRKLRKILDRIEWK